MATDFLAIAVIIFQKIFTMSSDVIRVSAWYEVVLLSCGIRILYSVEIMKITVPKTISDGYKNDMVSSFISL